MGVWGTQFVPNDNVKRDRIGHRARQRKPDSAMLMG